MDGGEEGVQAGSLGLRVVARAADVLVVADELLASGGDVRGGGLTLRRRGAGGVVLAGLGLAAVGGGTQDAISRSGHALTIPRSLERGTPLAEVLRAQAADVREAGKRQLLESGGRKEIAMMVTDVWRSPCSPRHSGSKPIDVSLPARDPQY